MIALVLFKMDGDATDEMAEEIGHKSLANVKQLTLGKIRDQVIVDIAGITNPKDLNVALGELAALPHVKSVTVLHITQEP
jgi:hypothetical protein